MGRVRFTVVPQEEWEMGLLRSSMEWGGVSLLLLSSDGEAACV